MTAIQAFSEQIAYKNIDSMIFGDARFSLYQEEDRDFYILARSNITTSEDMIEKMLSIVYNRFWKEFYQEIINFVGNVSHFQKFEKILESFDWTLLKKKEDVRITPQQKEMKRKEMKELVSRLPQDETKLLVNAPPSSGEVIQEEQSEVLNGLPNAEIFKKQRICLVHKGSIEGFIFSCPSCGALYCVKCVEALIDIDNMCWSCKEVLDPNKPS